MALWSICFHWYRGVIVWVRARAAQPAETHPYFRSRTGTTHSLARRDAALRAAGPFYAASGTGPSAAGQSAGRDPSARAGKLPIV